MKKKKWQRIGLISILILIDIGLAYNLYRQIKIDTFGTTIVEIEPLNLTKAQKVEDFEFFYDTVLESVPMIDCYKEAYGFNFADRREYYKEKVEATDNDYEFYCVMYAISNEIPSYHTALIEPYVNLYRSLHGYNRHLETSDGDILSTCAYWEECFTENCGRYRPDTEYSFKYRDGKYVSCTDNEETESEMGYILNSINGVGVDKVITEQLMMSPLRYDGKYKKPYRNRLVFNGSRGEPVLLVLTDESGRSISIDAYYDMYVEEAVVYYNIVPYEEDRLVIERNGVSYIKMDSLFSVDGEETANMLKTLKTDKIILDLRECYGGNEDFCAEYIYPNLFNQSFEQERIWYIPESEANSVAYDSLIYRIIDHFRSADSSPYSFHESYYYSSTTRDYVGGTFPDKKIVVLTSPITGSAADGFVSLIKNHKLATIIGYNTGGEGLASSYISMTCPNSLLAFMYMPGGAKNPDGTDNSVYGTAPDIYVSQTVEDFLLELKTGSLDENDENWDTILSYDTVLRYGVNYLLRGMQVTENGYGC